MRKSKKIPTWTNKVLRGNYLFKAKNKYKETKLVTLFLEKFETLF